MTQLLAILPYGFLLAGIITLTYGFFVTKDHMESWWHGLSSMCLLLACVVGSPALFERLVEGIGDLLRNTLHSFTNYLAAWPPGDSVMRMLDVTGISALAMSVTLGIACLVTVIVLTAVCLAPAFGVTAAALSWRKIPTDK